MSSVFVGSEMSSVFVGSEQPSEFVNGLLAIIA